MVSFHLVDAGSVVLTFHICEEDAVCSGMLQEVSQMPGNTLTTATGIYVGLLVPMDTLGIK